MADDPKCQMECGRRAAFRAQRFDHDDAVRLACGGHLAAAVRAVTHDDQPVMVTPLAKTKAGGR